jgi:hypothetical protein
MPELVKETEESSACFSKQGLEPDICLSASLGVFVLSSMIGSQTSSLDAFIS